jgi:hypothetical protein
VPLLVVPVGAGEETLPDPLEPIPPEEVSGNFDISDGNYAGAMGMAGAFWFSGDGLTVIWDGRASGPMSFTVLEGDLDGNWSMSGSASIRSYGVIDVTGANTWAVAGTVAGSNPYMLGGSGQGHSEATVAGFTSGSNYPINIPAVPLRGVVQVCGQVLGNWDQAIDEGYEGLPEGFGYNIPTYVSVMVANSISDLETRLEELLGQGLEIQQNLSQDPVLIAGKLGALTLEAEQLLGDLESHPDDCPPDPSFIRLITQLVGDVMNTFLSRWESEDPDDFQIVALQRFVEVGLRAGAIGAGAADPASAAYLEAKAEALLQRQFDRAFANEPKSDFDLTQLAITATMLDYTFDSGVSGPDICLVLGSC